MVFDQTACGIVIPWPRLGRTFVLYDKLVLMCNAHLAAAVYRLEIGASLSNYNI